MRKILVVTLLAVPASIAPGAQGEAVPASLSDLVNEASRNNPDVIAALRAWQAAAQVPSQAATLPDPQVTIQQFAVGSPRPFAGFTNSGFAYIGFGVSQDFPYPGKLKLRGEAAQLDAAAAREKFQAAKRAVVQQVKTAYFQIAYLQETLGVLERNSRLLEQIERITNARYRVGQGRQQDVLKAQLQRTRLLSEIAHHHQLMGSAQAQLRRLLNRSPDAPEIVVQQPTETPLRYTAEELLARVRSDNPQVTGRKEMVKRQSVQVELARKDRYPDFGVQYMYQRTGDKFPDYSMLTFSARLPIYSRRKLDPELTQAVEELNRSRREYESQVQSAYFEVRDQYLAAQTTSEILKIYHDGLIPQALSTYQAGLAAYQTGQLDFEALLSSFLDVLHFDEDYWKALSDHEQALARLEELTGVSFQ